MRKLLVVLLLVGGAFGQTKTTVTGVVQDASGNLATSGTVVFTLSPQNNGVIYFVTGTGIIAPQTGTCGIDGTGNIKNLALSGTCQVWGTDLIVPANLTYQVSLFPNGVGSPTNTIPQQCITGATYDLSNPKFCPIIKPTPQFASVITSPIQNNLIPSADNVFTLGSPSLRYSNIYAANGNFTNVTALNIPAGTINTGAGTTNTIPKYTNGATGVLGNSSITDNGTTVATPEALTALSLNLNSTGLLSTTAQSGTGSLCMTTNCVMTTPNIGTASGTSLSLAKRERDCRVADGLVGDGNTDDTTALNNCLANAFTNGQNPVILPCGLIRVNSPINDTNKPSLTINGCQGNQGFSTSITGNDYGPSQTMIVCNTRATGSGVCWDATGSSSQHITNVGLCNNTACSGKTFTNSSNIGFLFGRDNAVSGSGWITGTGTYCFAQFMVLDNVYAYFDSRLAATAVGTIAALNVGAEQFTILGGKYIADVPFFASQGNDLSIASPFQTIGTGCPLSLSEIEIRQAAAFQPWTGNALNIRSSLDIDMEPDTEMINGVPGTNHSAAIALGNAPFTNIWLRGQSESFDSVVNLNGNGSVFDHIYITMTAVSPTAGLITLNAGGTNVTNSIFAISQRNGVTQPLFNAATGVSTIKSSQLTEGTLSGSGTGAANITLTQSQIFAPGLADAVVNTFAAASNYDLSNDSGRSFIGGYKYVEGTAPTNLSGSDMCYGDSTSHTLKCSYNNGSYFNQSQTIASGTAVMPVTAFGAAGCNTTVTVAATGVLVTDTIDWDFTADPGATTGYSTGAIHIYPYTTAGNVNFRQCSSGAITPGAATLNWRVVR
jgi:hypothetical protein